jgi:hypothetical protein
MTCSQCANESNSATRSSGQERVRYFPRQLLTADDMRAEQEYFREKQRRHNRMLHGWGVVCGLDVVADTQKGSMAIQICPGYALGPCGDEIYLADAFSFDLTNCAKPANVPCTPTGVAAASSTQPPILAVKIRYADCPTRPMRTLPAGCGCDDSACEYSRIRDGFEIKCTLFSSVTMGTESTSSTGCPPCPDDPWLMLAKVTTSTAGLQIDTTVRKTLSGASP